MGWVFGFFCTYCFIYDEKFKFFENHKFNGSTTIYHLWSDAKYFMAYNYYKWIYNISQCLLPGNKKKYAKKNLSLILLPFYAE